MPYVHCPRCGLRTYSAARWSHVDRCANCDEVLAPAKRLTASVDELEVEDRVRERLYGGARSGNVDAVRRG
jgi:ribosomal protein L34E